MFHLWYHRSCYKEYTSQIENKCFQAEPVRVLAPESRIKLGSNGLLIGIFYQDQH
jgi:hypothetical protein